MVCICLLVCVVEVSPGTGEVKCDTNVFFFLSHEFQKKKKAERGPFMARQYSTKALMTVKLWGGNCPDGTNIMVE